MTLTLDDDSLKQFLSDTFDIRHMYELTHSPKYNIAPSQSLLTVIGVRGRYRSGYMRWGYVPPWSHDLSSGYRMINARSETVHEKTAFKESFLKRRCIILADSFYEWRHEGSRKIPYRFQLKNQQFMPLAGLYTTHMSEQGEKIATCTILTCEANTIMAPIHHRMPVILQPDSFASWLLDDASIDTLRSIMHPYSSDTMTCYAVNPIVNSAKIDDPRCIEPPSQPSSQQLHLFD